MLFVSTVGPPRPRPSLASLVRRKAQEYRLLDWISLRLQLSFFNFCRRPFRSSLLSPRSRRQRLCNHLDHSLLQCRPRISSDLPFARGMNDSQTGKCALWRRRRQSRRVLWARCARGQGGRSQACRNSRRRMDFSRRMEVDLKAFMMLVVLYRGLLLDDFYSDLTPSGSSSTSTTGSDPSARVSLD